MRPGFIFSAIIAVALSGCGSSGDTYVEEGPVAPEIPTETDAFIVQADHSGSGMLSYTRLESGAVLISCGDGDNSTCGVFYGGYIDDINNTGD